MRVKFELAALLIGLTGAGLATGLVSAWGDFPVEFTRWFKHGEFGFFALFCSYLIGLAGLVLMCINMIKGLRKLWVLRLFGFVCFLALSLSFGAYD